MFAWGRIGRPREGTHEMCAGWGGVGWVSVLPCIVYSTLVFIDVCMGEGRTASWRNLWNECWAGRVGVSVYLTLHSLFYSNSSGVSHSDGSCVLGRIHSDVSSNIPKKLYHIVTDNFVNLLHISYAWLYKTECWGRKFHAFSLNSHRNCKISMTYFNFIFDTICVPYIFRKSIFGWNCDHDTPLCDTPLLEDTPLCDTPDEFYWCLHGGGYDGLVKKLMKWVPGLAGWGGVGWVSI